MWIFEQKTGKLYNDTNSVTATGYSGHGVGKNNPIMQEHVAEGPIPCGMYQIEGPPFNSPKHGKYVLYLIPDKDNKMFGRNGFLMHGDSIEHPGEASLGCTCFARVIREKVWDSGDHRLKVISGIKEVAENSDKSLGE